jgi:predicted nuclease of predicted toxin-antitoxin system
VKLLADSCMSPSMVERLIEAGVDVDWVGNWPADPGDPNVLRAAHAAGRVLVTIDRGFGQLAVRYHNEHSGIIVIRKALAVDHAEITLRVIATHAADLAKGAVVIATGEKFRARWPRPDA